MKKYPSFKLAIDAALYSMQHVAQLVHTERWQGVDISQKPEMATYELLNHSFQVPIQSEYLASLSDDIQPNLPWADHHFNERTCGYPINPGKEWANWPYGKSAAKFLDEDGKFNHNYMERYWPRHAGGLPATDTVEEMESLMLLRDYNPPSHYGIYGEYGDLDDVVKQLAKEPLTRQAYLPIFFPEDTGGAHGGRVPCSLGYHFIMRNGYLHIVYWLRSCDIVRHLRDDIYLTVRLLLWVLDRLRELDPDTWNQVKPGVLTFMATSLHCFKADFAPMFGAPRD